MRRATGKVKVVDPGFVFLSTLSLRRATEDWLDAGTLSRISIHALLAESDLEAPARAFLISYFYPRSPCGERPCTTIITICTVSFLSTLSLRRATNCTSIGRPKRLYFYPRSPCGERLSTSERLFMPSHYFYPRSPCGERPANAVDQILPGHISIHALLAESDCINVSILFTFSISIHALLAESDLQGHKCHCIRSKFLSTLSLRRATPLLSNSVSSSAYFYPRSPCGERLFAPRAFAPVCFISIHALLAESDSVGYAARRRHRQFLSTLSLRRATTSPWVVMNVRRDFYPRSPCGERRQLVARLVHVRLFLSTLSLRRATCCRTASSMSPQFLSTLSLRRATLQRPAFSSPCRNFYPRSPCGERRRKNNASVFQFIISIHALLAESDVRLLLQLTKVPLFLSTLSLRRATFCICRYR